ncbi:MAG: alpha/beta hydrolase [Candidatus Kapabacteria bacterium]|nr:alpha/beta hydrolase [Candidatus Kapabacteria bacterium]
MNTLMKILMFVCVAFLGGILTHANASITSEQGIYVRDTGSVDGPCILFLHGGPGYNSWSFEAAMTDTLVTSGYRVITFDQRGSGRSGSSDQSLYTFQQALADIDSILTAKNIQKTAVVGHSFGGTLALHWARRNPERVSALLLIGSPLSYPNTFATIKSNMNRADTSAYPGLAHSLNRLANLDTSGVEYAGMCFAWAMKLGAYTARKPLDIGQRTVRRISALPDKKWLRNMTQAPFLGFLNNEKYTTLNLTPEARACASAGFPLLVLIGEHDGLFDGAHKLAWEHVLGAERLQLVSNASHTVFVDRPDVVFDAIRNLVKTR